MIYNKRITFPISVTLVALGGLTLAACGGGAAAAPATPPKTATPQPTMVGVARSSLGQILVDSQGRTLYLFQKDSGTTSACTGACAMAWPPLRTPSQPTAGSGLNANLLGTSPRSDGGTQVTYNGHPLYLFIKDQKPGDTNGQGVTAFGASWFALTPAGSQISSQTPSSPPASSSPTTPPPTTAPPTTPPTTPPALAPARTPAPPPATVAPKQPANPIPQGNGGDQDGDNNGGPSDGDGNI
jgi:predicted lipoprotein with Yx(FWY)xxD motif